MFLPLVGYGITGDLKEYLALRFEDDDIDSDLQKTIRDNLYERTVPCKYYDKFKSPVLTQRSHLNNEDIS